MAVKIRLKRMGKIRAPFYRVVVMDSRTKRDGRAIEEIGKYHPTAEPSVIEIDMDRANYWLGQGAQPTEAVAVMLKLYADGAVKTAEPKKSKKELYEAAVAAAGGSTLDAKDAPARKSAPGKKAAAKTAEKSAEAAPEKSDEPTAEKAAEKTAEPAPEAADTDSGAAAAQSVDTSDDPSATAVDGGYGPDSAAPAADGSAPDGFPVKGNKDSMKYHEPDGQWYDQTVAEVWFKDAAAAEKAGFVKAGS